MVIPKDVEVDVGCGNAFGGKNEEERKQETTMLNHTFKI